MSKSSVDSVAIGSLHGSSGLAHTRTRTHKLTHSVDGAPPSPPTCGPRDGHALGPALRVLRLGADAGVHESLPHGLATHDELRRLGDLQAAERGGKPWVDQLDARLDSDDVGVLGGGSAQRVRVEIVDGENGALALRVDAGVAAACREISGGDGGGGGGDGGSGEGRTLAFGQVDTRS